MSAFAGPEDKIYPVVKLAVVVDALAAEGISTGDALTGGRISKDAMSSAATRISLNEVIDCYRNAHRLSPDPHFAYRAGLRFHVTDYRFLVEMQLGITLSLHRDIMGP